MEGVTAGERGDRGGDGADCVAVVMLFGITVTEHKHKLLV